jgi:hypothetical protein
MNTFAFLRIRKGVQEKYWCMHCNAFKPRATYYNHREMYKRLFQQITLEDVANAQDAMLEGFDFGIFQLNTFVEFLNKRCLR